MKIGFLIPCTSKDRDWSTMRDTYLFRYTLKTFLATCCPGHEYVFYIGYDKEDPLFSKESERAYLQVFEKMYPLTLRFIELSDPPGYLTKMWNVLFAIAHNEGCEYFYQCGDDIWFRTRGWITDSIQTLQAHHNIGLTGPDNLNGRILTQAFVSRQHMDIFGEFFPESIVNWGCDDWYNWVYQDYLYPLKQHICTNEGGTPRYVINHDSEFDIDRTHSLKILRDKVYKQALIDQQKIDKYLKKSRKENNGEPRN